MEKSDLIKKWLDNNLDTNELNEFKKLEDYDELIKISEGIKRFKANDINQDVMLDEILAKKQKRNSLSSIIKPFTKIAAVLVLCLSVYFYISSHDTQITTLASEKTIVTLPDNSIAQLNAKSSITYNKSKWKGNREAILKGEAYFKVAKGSKFDVITNLGTISVLGTEFNIRERENNLQVICYEGSVNVSYKNKNIVLSPGDYFNSGVLYKSKIKAVAPTWITNESSFKSESFKAVIAEFERQYNVTMITKNINVDKQLFTGKFNHDNIEIALKSITVPFNLVYEKNGNVITLKSENH